MKVMIFAAVIAVSGAVSASVPAAAQDYGRTDGGVVKVPRLPEPPRAPLAPGERESRRDANSDRPFKPYEGYKPQRHYNIYTGRWE
jgi:hypothetical protein